MEAPVNGGSKLNCPKGIKGIITYERTSHSSNIKALK